MKHFSIRIYNSQPEEFNGLLSVEGEIIIGDYKETFIMPLDWWDIKDYKKQFFLPCCFHPKFKTTSLDNIMGFI